MAICSFARSGTLLIPVAEAEAEPASAIGAEQGKWETLQRANCENWEYIIIEKTTSSFVIKAYYATIS